MSTVRVLGISGSLRNGSHNLASLRAAKELLPEGMSLEIADPLDLPLYSEAASRDGFPEEVKRLRQRAAGADAFVFASPEYNYAISAALKNALEWASRPPDPPFAMKPCAILGATTSPAGTMRGQSNLRQVCVSLNVLAVNMPQLDIPEAHNKFDAEGRLIDQPTRDAIRLLMTALLDLTIRITPPERLSAVRRPPLG